MSETRRGAVILIRRGDAQISGAIADGMARALPPEQVEVVEAEIDRQHIQMSLLRVAVGNHKSAEDYADMMTKARGDYARYSRPAGPARRLGEGLLALYALLCYAVARVYKSQDRVLGLK